MSDSTETSTEVTDVVDTASTTTEGAISDPTPEDISESLNTADDTEAFPRQVVEDLRKENARYRQRAQESDSLAKRLHTELVRATGRLADPADLPYSEDHLADAGTMVAAIDALLEQKPHLASRKPAGDIGQGNRGGTAQPTSLLQMLRDRA